MRTSTNKTSEITKATIKVAEILREAKKRLREKGKNELPFGQVKEGDKNGD